jgi:hypothetical protein
MLDKTSTFVCVVLCGVLPSATAAADQEAETEAGSTPAAAADGDVQLTLPKGRLVLDAYLAASLVSGAVFKPFALSPDIWYGATDKVTVGLIHSSVGATGFIGGANTPLCLAGSDGGCGDVYSGFGLDARYPLKAGPLALAADGGLYIRHFDPFQLALKIGAVGRWHSGKIAVEFAPNLFFGLTNRSGGAVGTTSVAGNQEVFDLPATLLYAVTPKAALALQTGVILPLQSTGDLYAIPLSIGGHLHVNESLNVNLAFTLTALAGGSAQKTGFDGRSLTLGGTYAF